MDDITESLDTIDSWDTHRPSTVLAIGKDETDRFSFQSQSVETSKRFGLTLRTGPHLTKDTNDMFAPLIYKLCSLVRRWLPNHTFTSIQVMKNTLFSMHCDNSNIPGHLSAIIGLGNFKGGALQVFEGNQWVSKDMYRKFQTFDGRNSPHFTTEFDGDRFSIVFFTKWADTLSKEDLTFLVSGLGFNWPTQQNYQYCPAQTNAEEEKLLNDVYPQLPDQYFQGKGKQLGELYRANNNSKSGRKPGRKLSRGKSEADGSGRQIEGGGALDLDL